MLNAIPFGLYIGGYSVSFLLQSGKSAAIHACAIEEGFKVLEVLLNLWNIVEAFLQSCLTSLMIPTRINYQSKRKDSWAVVELLGAY